MTAEIIDFKSRRALPFDAPPDDCGGAVRFYIGDRVRLADGEIGRLIDWPEIDRGDGKPPTIEFLVQLERTGFRRLVPVSRVQPLEPPAPPCDVGEMA